MAIQLSSNQVSYDQTRPIRETIRATGRTIVTGANTVCNTIALVDDAVILARATIYESIIEAKVDAKQAELEGLDKLAELDRKIQAKRKELALA